MSQRYSSRYRQRDTSRKHVRRRSKQNMPPWFTIVAGLVALVALGLLINTLIGFLSSDDSTSQSQSNRTWLDESWTQQIPSEEQLETLSSRLDEHKIRVIYVETGAWRQDRVYREWDNAADFREQLNEAAPNVDALVWIWYEPARHSNETSQESLIVYAQNAISSWGYDGVHLQGYSVFDESESYISFVERLSQSLPDGSTLSITAPPDHSPTDVDVPRGQGNPSLSWRPAYKARIAQLVDEMVIMSHAAGLNSRDAYEAWVAYQVETYARDLNRVDADARLIVAFPTYPEELFHDIRIENVTSAANGAREGIQQADDAGGYITGGALYIYDTTTENDWASFAGFWLD